MKTLVIGASINPTRYSNIAVEKLKAANHSVIALGFRAGEIHDEIIHTEQQPWEGIDTVTLYLGPARQTSYYDYILSLQPRRVLFNPGTENDEFEALLIEKGIHAERACTLVLLSTNQY